MGDPLGSLAQVVGGEAVREPVAADRVAGVAPRAVCRPGAEAEVVEVLRACAGEGWRVVARGGGTKLSWGAPPERVDVLLDTTGLSGVVEHAAGDLVARVRGGAQLAAVQEELATRGQRIALESPHPAATVGGVIATGVAGPSRALYGTPRDLLIGVTVVLADGTRARSGGKVVKNVAGYDLGKLYAGSFGTLGIVTEAVFRLHPVPAARAHVCVELADPGQVGAAVARLRAARLTPSAVEVEREGAGWRLTVALEGVPAGVAARAEECAALLGGRIGEPPPGWARLPERPGGWLLKLVAEPAALPVSLTLAQELLGGLDGEFGLRGSAAVNVLWAAVCGGAADVAAAVGRLRRSLAAHDGSVTVLEAPPRGAGRLDRWGEVGAVELMRRVKERFDPQRLLSPGRFVGGI